MKFLIEAGCRLKLRLNPEYFLDDMNEALFNEALQLSKKQLEFNLSWLQQFLIRTLSRLQKSLYFRGDSVWQKKLSDTRSALSNPLLKSFQVLIVLRQANRIIEIAHHLIKVRAALVKSVQDHLLLSPEQERHYHALKERYQKRNGQLNALHQQVFEIQLEYNDFRQRRRQTPLAFKPVPMNLPRDLFDYHIEKEEIRILTAALKREMRMDKDTPALYQDLRKKLVQKSTLKKAPEDAQAAHIFLNDKASQIAGRAHCLKKNIQDDVQRAIEQRSQIMMAHAKKLEQLYSTLERIIHALESATTSGNGLLNSFFSKNPALARIMQQARLALAAISDKKATTKQIEQLQQHIEQLEQERQSYAMSITSQRNAFFFRSKQTQRKQELQLNQIIQSETANLINPLSGLQDVFYCMSNTEIHHKYTTVKQLEEASLRWR